ncbi:UbiA family prenyltransferase [Pseudooceanicola onchidii]|uniref:UbiA family prenyltransferase n=1 Tax=Pseudooceanicola onchidii TaxID=2562279 RepID=UPI0010AB130A|nr:UbiA family prenyltransferase [Pseudooceanicola onchidii]
MTQAEYIEPLGDARPVLVCDLDGVLIRTEMLDETFWASVAAGWTAPLVAIRALMRGRAALKQVLADRGPVDPEHLPYRPEIVARLTAWRAAGGRTALVTSADQAVAEGIADHLQVFDEVHGSNGRRNLRAATKAAFLVDRFGEGGYNYIGGVATDRPVWATATMATTIGLTDAARAKVTALGKVAHLDREPTNFPRALMRAMRPHQWLKNLLIFLPLLAAHQLDAVSLAQAVLAFITFGLVASSVYVLNDLLDLPSDRAHPRKRNRPFASGHLALRHGLWLAPGLFGAGVVFGALLGWRFLAVLGVYYATTTAYSLWLKRQPVVDICTLAALYSLRIAAGAAATAIPISIWLMAFAIFFFFSLAAVKRQAELVDAVKSRRALNTRRGYRAEDLPLVAMMAVGAGYVSVLVMALYVNSPAVTALYSTPEVLFGICVVLLFWISRVVMLAHRGEMHDDPVVFAARDKVSLGAFALVCAIVALGAQI